MRLSKTFIWAVSLGLVLVATVIVATKVVPGSFGFHDWPTASSAAPKAEVVSIDRSVNDVPKAPADTKRDAAAEQSADLVASVPDVQQPATRDGAPSSSHRAQPPAGRPAPTAPAAPGDAPSEPTHAPAAPVPVVEPGNGTLPELPAKDLPALPTPVLPDDDETRIGGRRWQSSRSGDGTY
jgi:hypothetical protein